MAASPSAGVVSPVPAGVAAPEPTLQEGAPASGVVPASGSGGTAAPIPQTTTVWYETLPDGSKRQRVTVDPVVPDLTPEQVEAALSGVPDARPWQCRRDLAQPVGPGGSSRRLVSCAATRFNTRHLAPRHVRSVLFNEPVTTIWVRNLLDNLDDPRTYVWCPEATTASVSAGVDSSARHAVFFTVPQDYMAFALYCLSLRRVPSILPLCSPPPHPDSAVNCQVSELDQHVWSRVTGIPLEEARMGTLGVPTTMEADFSWLFSFFLASGAAGNGPPNLPVFPSPGRKKLV